MSGRIAEFRERECQVLGISTDAIETHERWLATPASQGGIGRLEFPLASDPDGAVCRAYGVFVERQHVALRGVFIIDPNGVLQYHVVHSLSVGRSTDEILRVLEGLQIGGLCPAEREMGQAAMEIADALGPGRVFGQYEIEAVVGSGAFGKVFRARDRVLERTVALKVIRREGTLSPEALLAEARAAAALNHPNICMVYAVDGSAGSPVIVMEYVDGQSLAKLIESDGLSTKMCAGLARQIAQGMAAAHAAGIAHGDLKPANIMVAANGAAKVMDFGLARRVGPVDARAETMDSSSTGGSGLSGTPGYMAPEQLAGESATPVSDVFAFGLTLYEMLTGKPAVTGKGILDVIRHVDQLDGEALAASLPKPYADVARAALVREPSQRRITMNQIAERLA